jgi:hypothetical protein
MFSELTEVSFSFGNRNNILCRDDPVPSAALGVQKAEKILKRIRIRAVPEQGSPAAYGHQAFVFQFVEVVREGRARDIQFRLNVSYDQSVRLRRHQELHNVQPGFGAHRREHIGEANDLGRLGACNISIIPEI